MAGSTALFDANVLYPAPLRDLLMHLALTDLFQARWSDAIHDEWIRNVLEHRPDLTRGQLERTRRLMNAHARDALVTDFEKLIPNLVLPDPDDRHVLAAAIKGEADVIVTNNLKDFPAASLTRYGLEVQHPDVFVAALIEFDALAVVGAVKNQRANLRKPPVTAEALLETLERQGLATSVARLKEFRKLL